MESIGTQKEASSRDKNMPLVPVPAMTLPPIVAREMTLKVVSPLSATCQVAAPSLETKTPLSHAAKRFVESETMAWMLNRGRPLLLIVHIAPQSVDVKTPLSVAATRFVPC
jgi:hypothetical protein